MDNNTRKSSKENRKHTAYFIISSFLLSKYARKKIYKLNPSKIAILRFICDSIDLYFKKHKIFHTKIYQSQIAKQNCTSSTTVKRIVKALVKHRFIKFDDKKCIYSLGQLLLGWVKLTYGKEVGQIDLPLRSRSNRPTSKSSNFTNSAFKNLEASRADASKQSNSYLPVGDIVKTRMPKELREKAGIK